jgi:hypothetical protein
MKTNRFKAASIGDAVDIDLAYGAFHAAGYEFSARLQKDLLGFDSPFDPNELKELMRQSLIYNIKNVQTPALLEFGIKSLAPDQGRILF